MKKICKIVFLFNLMAFILILTTTPQVKAANFKPSTLLQSTKIFRFMIFDEKGKVIVGAIGKIKGREEKAVAYGETSRKDLPITIINPPTNAIIVISKEGYVTQEISTQGMKQPKGWNPEEFKKTLVIVKMVPVKRGGKQPTKKRKEV